MRQVIHLDTRRSWRARTAKHTFLQTVIVPCLPHTRGFRPWEAGDRCISSCFFASQACLGATAQKKTRIFIPDPLTHPHKDDSLAPSDFVIGAISSQYQLNSLFLTLHLLFHTQLSLGLTVMGGSSHGSGPWTCQLNAIMWK
jgi:hypothetical protein